MTNHNLSLDDHLSTPPKWCVLIDDNDCVFTSQCQTQFLTPFNTTIKDASCFQLPLSVYKRDVVHVLHIKDHAQISYKDWSWVSLKVLLDILPPNDFNVVGRAMQLVTWQRDHQFCGRCGKSTQYTDKNRALSCQSCNLISYPRISPCVIGLITRGDQCLLAHNGRHPEGMFSTLAGFIEAGETPEQAFEREVFEEVGLKIDNIQYLFSQPWPFPGQLMLGFTAEYKSGDIQVDNDEILEAKWFDVNALPAIPRKGTISYKIIKQFTQKVLKCH